jgi:hypothetical protein
MKSFKSQKLNTMMNESKFKNLKFFLRLWGVLTLLVMSINSTAFVFKILQFNPGGPLHWLIWDDVYGHVGPMIFVIYMVWAVYMFKAANDPIKYQAFLDFTIWANIAHGAIMIPMALNNSMYYTKFLTDIPFILGLSLGVYLFSPNREKRLQTT